MSNKGRYILIFFATFSLVYLFRFKAKTKTNLKAGDQVKITATLSQEPILQDNYQLIKINTINNISIKASRFPAYHYADRLIIVGTLKTQAINLFLKQFLLVDPAITLVKSYSKKLSIREASLKKLFNLRNKLEEAIGQVLPEPHAGLLIGILLGTQQSLPQDFYQALKTTGTLHIVVASGMNISLTAGILLNFLVKFLGRKLALFVSLVCILIYCLLAGMNPPIVRAGIMAAILYLAQFSGRQSIGLLTLVFTGAMMLFINPLLLFDASFQLSFSATSGLMLLTSALEKIFYQLPQLLKEILSQTLACQIATLPILVIAFGHFNPLSVIPNIFVLWLVPYLMIFGMVISLAGLICLALAQFFGWLIWLPLTYFIVIINFFGQFKFMDLQFTNLSWIAGIGYYLVLIGLMTIKKKKQLN